MTFVTITKNNQTPKEYHYPSKSAIQKSDTQLKQEIKESVIKLIEQKLKQYHSEFQASLTDNDICDILNQLHDYNNGEFHDTLNKLGIKVASRFFWYSNKQATANINALLEFCGITLQECINLERSAKSDLEKVKIRYNGERTRSPNNGNVDCKFLRHGNGVLRLESNTTIIEFNGKFKQDLFISGKIRIISQKNILQTGAELANFTSESNLDCVSHAISLLANQTNPIQLSDITTKTSTQN